MKKHKIILAAGIAASLMLAAGCSNQASAGNNSQAASESQTEAQTEESKQETESETSEENEAESGENAASEEEGGLADEFASLKIWGTITEVTDNTIVVDNQSEFSSFGEIIFNIDPEETLVLDAVTGFPVELADVQLGDFEAYLGPVMTMSLPPQTTPYVVVVNITEDAAVPQYVISAKAVEEKDGSQVLTAADGAEYTLAQEVEVLPFLTRNIVKLEDIGENSRCLLWMNTDGLVEKIVLFAE